MVEHGIVQYIVKYAKVKQQFAINKIVKKKLKFRYNTMLHRLTGKRDNMSIKYYIIDNTDNTNNVLHALLTQILKSCNTNTLVMGR